MRTAVLDLADASFPVSLVDEEPPALPAADWVRVRVGRAGICGSDLGILAPRGRGSRVGGPLVRMPMRLGHEFGGTVSEAGPAAGVEVGTRVAVDPVLTCEAKGLDPCPRCGEGANSACERLDHGHGMGLGFTTLPGGWSDEIVAHRSQLHVAPDGLDDRDLALTEPFGVALHGLLRRPPADGAPVLVIGAGIIGLAAVAASRAVAPDSPVTVLARHDHQARIAEALGAAAIVRPDPDGGDPMADLAHHSGGRMVGEGRGVTLSGGFPHVVEAVGSADTVDLALRCAGQRGTVHLLGSAGIVEVDLGSVWFREVDLIGSLCYAVDGGPGGVHTYDRALVLQAAGALPADLVVTHEFPLADLRDAVATASDKGTGAVKVQLAPGA